MAGAVAVLTLIHGLLSVTEDVLIVVILVFLYLLLFFLCRDIHFHVESDSTAPVFALGINLNLALISLNQALADDQAQPAAFLINF